MKLEWALALLDEIAADSMSGALVVGRRQAFIFFLMGAAQHAVAGTLTGMEAVKEAASMMGHGTGVNWRSDEPQVPGATLSGWSMEDLRAALVAGSTVPRPARPATIPTTPVRSAKVEAMKAAVVETLHLHGRRLVTDIDHVHDSPRNLIELALAVRDMRPRGISPETMQKLGEELLEIATTPERKPAG